MALMGVLMALNQVFLLIASIIESNTFFFLGIASLPLGIIVIERGWKKGVLFFIGSLFLAFFIIPDKLILIPYAFVFGNYGVVKYLIEGRGNIVWEIIFKAIYLNITFIGAVIISKNILGLSIPLYLILGANIVFFIYDYAYSLFISEYQNKIRGKIKWN